MSDSLAPFNAPAVALSLPFQTLESHPELRAYLPTSALRQNYSDEQHGDFLLFEGGEDWYAMLTALNEHLGLSNPWVLEVNVAPETERTLTYSGTEEGAAIKYLRFTHQGFRSRGRCYRLLEPCFQQTSHHTHHC
jgi:hypothetical protein